MATDVVVVVVVVVVVSDVSTVCMSTAVMTMQQSLRPIGGRSPGSRDSGGPRHLPSPRRRRTLRRRGLPKINWRNMPTAENICENQKAH